MVFFYKDPTVWLHGAGLPPMYVITCSNNTFDRTAHFCREIHPMNMVDSSTYYVGECQWIHPKVAMFRSFFWPVLLARGFPIRILLFGYMELDHLLSMLSPILTTPLTERVIFLSWNTYNEHGKFIGILCWWIHCPSKSWSTLVCKRSSTVLCLPFQ